MSKVLTEKKQRRHQRIRAKLKGTELRPRVSVARSLRGLTVQLIDDVRGITVVAVTSEIKPGLTKMVQAVEVGKQVAKKAQAAGIKQVVFDRGGQPYQGRIKALAETLREEGLVF
jgi:large subunit ribosomal protein L18